MRKPLGKRNSVVGSEVSGNFQAFFLFNCNGFSYIFSSVSVFGIIYLDTLFSLFMDIQTIMRISLEAHHHCFDIIMCFFFCFFQNRDNGKI